jgi:hypothetical protein
MFFCCSCRIVLARFIFFFLCSVGVNYVEFFFSVYKFVSEFILFIHDSFSISSFEKVFYDDDD